MSNDIIYLSIMLGVGLFYLFYRYLPTVSGMWIVGDGIVGIGTDTPDQTLHVSDSNFTHLTFATTGNLNSNNFKLTSGGTMTCQ